MRSYDNYLFDLDGTLIDSTGLIVDCFRYSLKKVAGIEVDPELIKSQVGLPLKEQFSMHLKGRETKYSVEDAMKIHMDYQVSVWKEHLRLIDGVIPTLEAIKARGARLAVVTSRRIHTAELYAEGLGIKHFFETFVTPESTKKHKPHPEPALEAMRRLGAKPGESLFVGDAIFDIQSGRDAGTDTCYVAWGHGKASELAVKPTWVIQRMEELIQ
ncbi:MAG: HAD-IA family hydrolase [Spirochaetia bacterium]|nr:HAD-IA family hydrolase [Spirochaetia bacterium]